MNARIILFSIVGTILFAGFAVRWLLQSHGLTITSHWRNPLQNASVEGKPLSLHLVGLAWDIRTRGVVNLNEKLHNVLRWVPWLRVVPESDHIHIQFL